MTGEFFRFKKLKRRRPAPEDHQGCYVRLTLRDGAPNRPPDGRVLGYLYGFGIRFWGGIETGVPTINLSEHPWPDNQNHRLFTYDVSDTRSLECVQHSPVPWKRHL